MMNTLQLPDWLRGARRIAIVGYGREGKSTERFLRVHLPQAWVMIFDAQEEFELPAVDVIFKSPGIPLRKLKFPSTAYLTSQADLFVQMYSTQTIAVTGTKGKSTTAHAIHHVLSVTGRESLLLGNIGKPALDYCEQMSDSTWAVFEMSSFQTESLHIAPHIAVFTSLYQDHLDYYESYEDYMEAKQHMFSLQTPDDICLYRDEYPEIRRLLAQCLAKKYPYTKETCPDPINYMPARIISGLLGLSEKQINSALATVPPLPGRLECVATVENIRFIDDALATIPEATISALDTLGDDVVVLIAGGHERHQNFSALADRIVHSHIQTLILFPTTGERIATELQKLGNRIPVTHVSSMKEAVSVAYEVAINDQRTKNGSPIILLSAASPSFGLFTDYADRSKQYLTAIRDL